MKNNAGYLPWILLLSSMMFMAGCHKKTVPPNANTAVDSASGGQGGRNSRSVRIRPLTERTKALRRHGDSTETRRNVAETTEPQVIVSGKITFEDGKPVTSATIKLLGLKIRPDHSENFFGLAEAHPTDAGTYKLTAPNLFASSLLVDSQEGTPEKIMFTPVWGDWKPARLTNYSVDIKVAKAISISGDVVDERGRSLPGIPVQMLGFDTIKPSWPQAEYTPSATTTTANGSFKLNGVKSGGNSRLMVRTDGFVPYTEAIENPTSAPRHIVLKSGGGSLRGIVVRNGSEAPISSATVTAKARIDGKHVAAEQNPITTRTDATGQFRFDHLADTTYTLTAICTDQLLVPGPARPRPVYVKDGETTAIKIEMFPGYTITGTVFDKATSEPIEGAQIEFRDFHPVIATSDTTGVYKLEHVFTNESELSLVVTKDGYITGDDPTQGISGWTKVKFDNISEIIHFDVPMDRAVAISGQVKNHDGLAVPDTFVYVANTPYIGYENPYKSQIPTAPDGSYIINVPPFSKVIIGATTAGYADGHSNILDVGINPINNADITIERGVTASGSVVDSDNKPLAGAIVQSIKSLEGQYSYYFNERSCKTGADGKFILSDLAVDPQVTAWIKQYSQLPAQNLKANPGDLRAGLIFKEERSHSINGIVVTESGNSISSCTIELSGTKSTSMTLPTNKTFNFKDLPDGLYTVTALTHGHQYPVADLPSGSEGVIIRINDNEWRRTSVLIGTVVDADTSAPIQNFSGDHSIEKDQNRSGGFLLKFSPTDDPVVSITASGYKPLTTLVQVPEGMTKLSEEFPLQKVDLGSAVTGRVVDGTKNPVKGAQILNFGNAPLRMENNKPISYTISDDLGKFVLAPVDPGKIQLIIKPSTPLVPSIRMIEVKSGNTIDLGDIPVFAGATINGQLKTAGNKDQIVNKKINIISTNNTRYLHDTAQTDDKGVFTFTGLSEGNYSINISDPEIGQNVHLDGGETKVITLEIGSVTLSGKVSRRGKPVNSYVNIYDKGSGRSYTYRATDGTYHIKIPSGDYTANVSASFPPFGDRPVLEKLHVPAVDQMTKDFTLSSGRVIGTVIDDNNQPVADATITLPSYLPTQSHSDGSFTIDPVSPGDYSLIARKEGRGADRQDDIKVGDGDTHVKLTIRKNGGALEETAVTTNGAPASTAICRLAGTKGEYMKYSQVRNASGLLRISDIPPGTYTVFVGGANYSNAEHQVEIKPGETTQIKDVLQFQ